jgi:hypothetical protein
VARRRASQGFVCPVPRLQEVVQGRVLGRVWPIQVAKGRDAGAAFGEGVKSGIDAAREHGGGPAVDLAAGIRHSELVGLCGASEMRTQSDRQRLHRSRDPSPLKVLSPCPPKRRPISSGVQVATWGQLSQSSVTLIRHSTSWETGTLSMSGATRHGERLGSGIGQSRKGSPFCRPRRTIRQPPAFADHQLEQFAKHSRSA